MDRPVRSNKTSGGSDRQKLGASIERLAAGALEQRGYAIIARNVHYRVGELDIVALKDGQTVFVEVRARRDESGGAALASIAYRKQKRLIAAAELFLALHPEVPPEARIDVVAVTLDRNGVVRAIDLVENAVEGGR